jgi:hypothetical protein
MLPSLGGIQFGPFFVDSRWIDFRQGLLRRLQQPGSGCMVGDLGGQSCYRIPHWIDPG